jgi:hypothetical protein
VVSRNAEQRGGNETGSLAPLLFGRLGVAICEGRQWLSQQRQVCMLVKASNDA